jgi:hypothetical protein
MNNHSASRASLANVISLAAVRKTREPRKPRLDDVSFVVAKKEGRKRMCGFNHWNVTRTGNYTEDIERGRQLAVEYLAFLDRSAFPLQWIVVDMPRTREEGYSGVEVGFLSTLTLTLRIGGLVARSL